MSSEETQKIISYLRGQLIGPADGQFERLKAAANTRYLVGMLFPQDMETEDAFDFDDLNELEVSTKLETEPTIRKPQDISSDADEDISLSVGQMPSSVGLSFVVDANEEVQVEVTAGDYHQCVTVKNKNENKDENENKEKECEICSVFSIPKEDLPAVMLKRPWQRIPLEDEVTLSKDVFEVDVFNGKGKVSSKWRPIRDGNQYLVTVALVNTQKFENGKMDYSQILAQTKLVCRAKSFYPYPSNDFSSLNEDDQEQALVYRSLPVFAIGHGCSSNWKQDQDLPVEISSDFIPEEEMPGINFDISGNEESRDLRELMKIDTNTLQVITSLKEFSGSYRKWIKETATTSSDVTPEMESTRDRLVALLKEAADRIDEGISLLEGCEDSRMAFALANKAMLQQMHHIKIVNEEKSNDEFLSIDYESEGKFWRSFQLAFILMVLPSINDPEHEYRDTVDLIWFPTGGGKTEAYLGLIAYQILWNRLKESRPIDKIRSKTEVITRYTLRLLTNQQFQRSSTLICALELIRRENTNLLGDIPITIGLWTGAGNSPNTWQQAEELLEELKNGNTPEQSFQIEKCSWCGTSLIPQDLSKEESWGIKTGNDFTKFKCPSNKCPFHAPFNSNDELPIATVDEELYENPPTFLIATIDKFAQVAWQEKAGVFLGHKQDSGPSLIIQDELHLLSGPLGTVAAIYETAFDIVMSKNSSRPKMVASTATIKCAEDQVRGLFDREVFKFPPSGLSYDDSFFVKNDTTVPGRKYLGIMSQSSTHTKANVQTSAALLQAPIACDLEGKSLDAYWTLVAYYNSFKELGKGMTLATDDIPLRIKEIASDSESIRELPGDSIEELTSRRKGSELPIILNQLGVSQESEGCISLLPCTNMISVGIDVPRLSLMLVLGQPHTTAEYIQATSRVGRDKNRPPGLVVTLYSSARPRDRSHYESFKHYHQTIHRGVEPSSVTPWAAPARERALHAALIIATRFYLDLAENDEAIKFPTLVDNGRIAEVKEKILQRVTSFNPTESEATDEQLDSLILEWEESASDQHSEDERFPYSRGKDKKSAVMKRFNSKSSGLWETLDSMRSVSKAVQITVIGEERDDT